MPRLRVRLGVLSDDLYIEPETRPRIGRPPKHHVETWTVTDDWPEHVPVAQADAARAVAMLETSSQQSTMRQMVQRFARTARERIRIEGGGYRRDRLRAIVQRVEVSDRKLCIIGSKRNLLQTLAAAGGVKPATLGVRSSVLKWRRGRDSNPRYRLPSTPD